MQPKTTITPLILELISEIDEFKGKWKALSQLTPDRLRGLKRIATIESIGSSTRIEGVKLSDQEVERLLSGLQKTSFRSRDEEEVAGYAEAIEMVFESFENIPLTENHIQQLHGALLKYSTKDQRHRGYYKKFPNHVEAFDSRKKSLGVIFQTASPFETPQRMKELVDWTKQSLEQKTLHPLLLIAIFLVHFLAIHPFQDGNGRLSRILTTLLLLRHGYSYVPYSSMEHLIEENKDQYYLALRRAQSTLKADDSQLNEWILFFLKTLKKQKDILTRKVDVEKSMFRLSPLSQEILRLAQEHGRITNAAIQSVTGSNRNTVKATLEKLVKEERLIRHGKKKGTGYTLK